MDPRGTAPVRRGLTRALGGFAKLQHGMATQAQKFNFPKVRQEKSKAEQSLLGKNCSQAENAETAGIMDRLFDLAFTVLP
jgi:hypothetical protein